MNVTYKRDVNHNYMIWYGEQLVDTGAYSTRMILQNHIEGLLPCSIQYMDNQTCFYYDVTSRQSLALLCEKRKMGESDLRAVLDGILRVMGSLGDFLLEVNDLCLDPQYMFWNWDTREITMCFVPGSGWNIEISLCRLAQYLLECIDQNSGEAVVFGYNLYRSAAAGELTVDRIARMLYEKKEEKKQNVQPDIPLRREKTEEELRQHQEDLDAFFAADQELFGKQEHAPYLVTAVTVAIGLVVCFAVCAILQVDLLTDWYLIAAAAIVLAGTVFGGIWLCRKKEKEKKQEKENVRVSAGRRQIDRDTETGLDAMYAEKQNQLFPKDGGEEETTLLQTSVCAENAKLISMDPEKIDTIRLSLPITMIGKQEQAVDAVVDKKTVSRIHARIQNVAGVFYLEDLNSKNGTYLDDAAIEPGRAYLLQDGQQVRFADAVFTFCHG